MSKGKEPIKTINLGDHIGIVDVVKGTGKRSHDCHKCLIEELLGDCSAKESEALTGIDCSKEPIYFVKHIVPRKQQWIQCTPENIVVGDVVREYEDSPVYKIVYTLQHEDSVLIEFNDDCECDLELFEYIELISNLEKLIKE